MRPAPGRLMVPADRRQWTGESCAAAGGPLVAWNMLTAQFSRNRKAIIPVPT
jgi:hypothetical protein